MEGKSPDTKRSSRATKGKAPAHLDDYYVQPTVRPQELTTPVGHHLPPSSGVRRRKAGKEDIDIPQSPPLLPQSQHPNAAHLFQHSFAAHPFQQSPAAYQSQQTNAAHQFQQTIAALPSQHPNAAQSFQPPSAALLSQHPNAA